MNSARTRPSAERRPTKFTIGVFQPIVVSASNRDRTGRAIRHVQGRTPSSPASRAHGSTWKSTISTLGASCPSFGCGARRDVRQTAGASANSGSLLALRAHRVPRRVSHRQIAN
jgi:hypothetical protein